jgi:transcriptional regulator with XRE-family HTH domain
MDGTPLQRQRRARNWTQDQVADQLRQLAGRELGIDANAVSRHERGIIAMPRAPYPELYAKLYQTTVETLWPAARIDAMHRRQFLQALAATTGAALLPGADPSMEAITSVTGGFRRLEATTPAGELRGPVGAHLRFIDGQLGRGGAQVAAAASEAAGFAAWLAVDQADDAAAGRHYRRAVGYAERSGSDTLAAYMLGSMALWAAETGRGSEARRLIGRANGRIPATAPPTVQAWSAAIEGMAHAGAGDADASLAACKRAEAAVAAGHEPMWPWLYPFDAARLAGYVGACATRLRLPRTALPALGEALDGLEEARTKQRALVLADLAANHRALGDHEQARDLAAQAEAIGVERSSPKVLQRVRLAA